MSVAFNVLLYNMRIFGFFLLFSLVGRFGCGLAEESTDDGNENKRHTCVYNLDLDSMGDFSNCAFLDPGYHGFRPMTMPTCPASTDLTQGVTPRYADYGEECFSFRFPLQLTNASRIIVDFWYHAEQPWLINYARIGFLRNEKPVDDVSWALISDTLATDSDEWQRVTTDPVGDVDVRDVRLAVLTLLEKAFFFVDKITVTDVVGYCNDVEFASEATEKWSIEQPAEEIVIDKEGQNSCVYDFHDGKMTGLESCIGTWIDEGCKVISLPGCQGEDRYVLTPKSMSLTSIIQTNRNLTLTENTEIQIRFWYETESPDNLKYLRVAVFTETTAEDNDGRDIVQEWRVKPSNGQWQTFQTKLNVNSTVLKAKVLVDLGLYQDKVFVGHFVISNVLNAEECYLEKEQGQRECL